jgi:tetratricopeptide (TPR) repeat protein
MEVIRMGGVRSSEAGSSSIGQLLALTLMLTLGLGCQSEQKTAKEHFEQGWVYAEKGFWDEAISEFKEAVRLDPVDARAHHSLGVALARKNLWDLAFAEFKESIRLEPELPQPHYGLGAAYVRKSDRRGAMEQYMWLKDRAPMLAGRLLNRMNGKWQGDDDGERRP